jgi:hypothetical protein
MFAAREGCSLPRNYGPPLLQLHGRRPFANTPEEIAALASVLRDRNFRIETAEDGIHVYSNRLHEIVKDALSFYPNLSLLGDTGHADVH